MEERDLAWLRRQIVGAFAADDELFDLLVLKGGNALALAHGVGMRASLDLDYSLSREDLAGDEPGESLRCALVAHLERVGLVVFDWAFARRPRRKTSVQWAAWGGYQAEFKVIEASRLEELVGDLEQARKSAWGVTPGGGASRKFRVELSRLEFCDGAGGATEMGSPDSYATSRQEGLASQFWD